MSWIFFLFCISVTNWNLRVYMVWYWNTDKNTHNAAQSSPSSLLSCQSNSLLLYNDWIYLVLKIISFKFWSKTYLNLSYLLRYTIISVLNVIFDFCHQETATNLVAARPKAFEKKHNYFLTVVIHLCLRA